MVENSRSISEWAVSVFGDTKDDKVVLERAAKEFKELQELVDAGIKSYKVAVEAADVVICLARLVDRQGYDLFELVDKKMEINRKRKWISTGDGCGRHVNE